MGDNTTHEAWTAEELQELMNFQPLPGSEVIKQGLTGLLKDQEIIDSLEWVKEIRKKENNS